MSFIFVQMGMSTVKEIAGHMWFSTIKSEEAVSVF